MFNLKEEEEDRALTIHRKAIVVDTHNDTVGNIMTGPADPLPPGSGSAPV